MKDMLGRGRAVSVEEALSLLMDGVSFAAPGETRVLLDGAFGRVVSKDVVSPEDLPGFSRSSMDGYAVSSSDTFGASESSPAYLDVAAEVRMGEEPAFELRKGQAARISTGGMLPRGADAVLMLEHAELVDEKMVEAQRAVAPGENVVRRGEDVRRGEVVLKRGRRLRPQDVSVLAALGITEVEVFARPAVSVISTGDEVVPHKSPAGAGRVRDSNSHLLAGLLRFEGAEPLYKGIVRDEYGPLRDAVAASLAETGAVLISGGSSVGTRDVTEKVVTDMGRLLFHSVSMKPGKPMLAGVVGGKPVFGLPGHPRAVAVCFDVFVRPAVSRLCGESEERVWKKTVRARLSKGLHSGQGRLEYVLVSLERGPEGLIAVPVLGKSGLISTMVKADGAIAIPLGRLGMDRGEEVEVALF